MARSKRQRNQSGHPVEHVTPGVVRASGISPTASVPVPPGVATAGGISPGATVRVGGAIEHDIALPIRAIKSAVTPPPSTATPAERRQWMAEEGYIFTSAGAAAAVGGFLGGPAWGVAAFLLGGTYASIKVMRRRG